MSGKLGLSAAGRKLLNGLRVARTPEELAAAGLPAELLTAMQAHGLLQDTNETVAPADHQEIYVNWPSQRGMLLDHTRTLAFQRAIETVVQPGDRVVDVGTGSGILSMMSARAGAASVSSLEFTEMAAWAEKLAAENGLDAMRVIRGDAYDFTADQPVDVVLGEFAGFFLIDEWRHYAAFCNVRDRNLKPGGSVLPYAGRLYLSAVDSRKLYLVRGYGFWEGPVYGFDFSAVRGPEIASPRRYVVSADQNDIVATQEIAAFDFLTGSADDFFFVTETTFTYPVAGRFHGLIGHFQMDMAPGQVLSTDTADHQTHWHQVYFPVPALDVPAGGEVAVRARSYLDPDTGVQHFGIAVAGPGERLTEATPEHSFRME